MMIHGLQKMTLLDFPGRVACTVFLGGCDFRCPFCHNFELVNGRAKPFMSEEELFAFLAKRRGLIDGVAITGGEPCLRHELPEFMRRIRNAGFAVKLDTNGAHPEMLDLILRERLADYIAMDVKNSPAKYAMTAGLEHMELAPVERSIKLLMEQAPDYEFRTTVISELHTEADIQAIAQWIRGAKRYFLQAFVDRETVPFEGFHAPDRESMLRFREIAAEYVPDTQLRGVEV